MKCANRYGTVKDLPGLVDYWNLPGNLFATLTDREIAVMLGVCRNKVRRWRRDQSAIPDAVIDALQNIEMMLEPPIDKNGIPRCRPWFEDPDLQGYHDLQAAVPGASLTPETYKNAIVLRRDGIPVLTR